MRRQRAARDKHKRNVRPVRRRTQPAAVGFGFGFWFRQPAVPVGFALFVLALARGLCVQVDVDMVFCVQRQGRWVSFLEERLGD